MHGQEMFSDTAYPQRKRIFLVQEEAPNSQKYKVNGAF